MRPTWAPMHLRAHCSLPAVVAAVPAVALLAVPPVAELLVERPAVVEAADAVARLVVLPAEPLRPNSRK